MDHRKHKKNLIISYKNLSEDLRELFKETYPEGHADHLQKTIKPNGEPIFVVPLETEDTMYMVKFNVQIDSGMVEEDLDKDLYDDKGDEGEFAPLSEAIDKEEGNLKVGALKHGAYEDIEASAKEFEIASADIAAEFGDNIDDSDYEHYGEEGDEEEEQEEEEDFEPSDEDLMNIDDNELMDLLNDDLTDLTPKKTSKKSTSKTESKKTATPKSKEEKPTKKSTPKAESAKVAKVTKAKTEPKTKKMAAPKVAKKEVSPKATKSKVTEPKSKTTKTPKKKK